MELLNFFAESGALIIYGIIALSILLGISYVASSFLKDFYDDLKGNGK